MDLELSAAKNDWLLTRRYRIDITTFGVFGLYSFARIACCEGTLVNRAVDVVGIDPTTLPIPNLLGALKNDYASEEYGVWIDVRTKEVPAQLE